MKMPIYYTAQYEHWRIRNSALFIPGSFRTQDIGRPGLSKRIAGKLKSSGKWATVSLLISNDEPPSRKSKLREIAKSLIRGR